MSVRADQHFTIIPEWVLYADVSANAVRLYGALRRYADKEGKAHPSRSTLATDIRVKSVRTVDAALAELEGIGAVATTQRRTGKLNLTSLYTVISAPPSAADCTTPSATGSTTPVQQTAQRTRAIQPEPVEREKSVALATSGDGFETFWKIYPRREAKGDALRAFRKARKVVTLAVILAAAERYRDDPNREPRYTAHPATWLNRDGWNDDPLPSSSMASGALRTLQLARRLEEAGQ